MVEDKLSAEERRRLECLAQAVALYAYPASGVIKASAETVVKAAKEFEKWVRHGS